MKTIISGIGIALLVFIFGCASSVSVKHDYDPGYNFTNLKTYDWLPVKSENLEISELRIKRFQNAVNQELAAKGKTLSSENPDFLIALHGMTKTRVNVTDWGYSYGPYWRAGYRDVDVSSYEEGTIFLDFVDAESKELFWRGVGTGVAEPNLSAEQQEKKFASAASKLLEKFPPSAGK